MSTNFQAKQTTLNFWAQICPKMDFGFFICLDSESAPPRYHVSQLSVKMDNFKFFGLNLGKLPNYMRYFGSNIVEGVTESLVEVDMSWVEMDGAGWSWVEVVAWFSNTRLKKHAWCDSITATLFKSVI